MTTIQALALDYVLAIYPLVLLGVVNSGIGDAMVAIDSSGIILDHYESNNKGVK